MAKTATAKPKAISTVPRDREKHAHAQEEGEREVLGERGLYEEVADGRPSCGGLLCDSSGVRWDSSSCDAIALSRRDSFALRMTPDQEPDQERTHSAGASISATGSNHPPFSTSGKQRVAEHARRVPSSSRSSPDQEQDPRCIRARFRARRGALRPGVSCNEKVSARPEDRCSS